MSEALEAVNASNPKYPLMGGVKDEAVKQQAREAITQSIEKAKTFASNARQQGALAFTTMFTGMKAAYNLTHRTSEEHSQLLQVMKQLHEMRSIVTTDLLQVRRLRARLQARGAI